MTNSFLFLALIRSFSRWKVSIRKVDFHPPTKLASQCERNKILRTHLFIVEGITPEYVLRATRISPYHAEVKILRFARAQRRRMCFMKTLHTPTTCDVTQRKMLYEYDLTLICDDMFEIYVEDFRSEERLRRPRCHCQWRRWNKALKADDENFIGNILHERKILNVTSHKMSFLVTILLRARLSLRGGREITSLHMICMWNCLKERRKRRRRRRCGKSWKSSKRNSSWIKQRFSLSLKFFSSPPQHSYDLKQHPQLCSNQITSLMQTARDKKWKIINSPANRIIYTLKQKHLDSLKI